MLRIMSQLKHYNIVLDSENLLVVDKLLIDLHVDLICKVFQEKFLVFAS